MMPLHSEMPSSLVSTASTVLDSHKGTTHRNEQIPQSKDVTMLITLGAFKSAEMSENEKWKQHLQAAALDLIIT
jgi:hypothetical protein